MPLKLTKIDFIERSNKIQNNKYDYSLVDYVNVNTNVIIICPKHGQFNQRPKKHMSGQGCPKCNGNEKYDLDYFIEKSNKIHNNKYDYSKSEYNGSKNKIEIICSKHGSFHQTVNEHTRGGGCPNCNVDRMRIGKDKFTKRSNQIHNDRYDYSLVDYVNNKTEVIIICPKHGQFKQVVSNHLSGSGCLSCKLSKGENKVENYLKDNNIKYIKQKRFKDCKNINTLPFDFYLTTLNICVEYDGIQHFKIVEHFGGAKEFKQRQINDEIKNHYCKSNNIQLLRIKYDEDIFKKLDGNLNI